MYIKYIKAKGVIVMTKNMQKKEHIFFAMGTVCSITVFDDGYDNAVAAAQQRVIGLHEKFNAYDPESEISRINENAGSCFISVSDDTFLLIRHSINHSLLTEGLFDITTTPLSLMWKEAIKKRALPDTDSINEARSLIGYNDIIIKNGEVMLNKKGQKIDLGAIAKGYAADEARKILSAHGIKRAVINFGGTVITLGNTQTVGIQNPFEKTGTPFASVLSANKAVVSSGLYEQSAFIEKQTVHHIIDPKTGYPSKTDNAGVTLIGDCAEALDALSTAVFIMDIPDALPLLKKFSAEAVFIRKNGDVFITDGLKNDFRFL